MSFSNLFKELSAVDEHVKTPDPPARPLRNEADRVPGITRKRKAQGEQAGRQKKRPYHQSQTAWNEDEDSKATNFPMQHGDSKRASVGFSKEAVHNHGYNAGHNTMWHDGQKQTTNYNRDMNKHQLQNKKAKKFQHQQKGQWTPPNKWRGHQRPVFRNSGGCSKNNKQKQDVMSMTQEFRDQNALLVDGRFVCKHFVWGRCIKGDDCQLEHIQPHNNALKEACKFYIQGCCTKGENCPYMHKSFPCKFFHRKGTCTKGEDCRFSHEPLDDVTKQLLDEALKVEKELYEPAKAEEESSGKLSGTEESETTQQNKTPDVPTLPLWVNFYNTEESNAKKETLLCETEEVADVNLPSDNLQKEEPACYSVEAVLGPQLSKPFSSLCTTQDSSSLSVLHASSSPNQGEAPYSVDAVLRSCRSMDSSTFGNSRAPAAAATAQTVFYTPKTGLDKSFEPLLRSASQHEKSLYLVNTKDGAKKFQEETYRSVSLSHVQTGPMSVASVPQKPAERDSVRMEPLSAGDKKVDHNSSPPRLREENRQEPIDVLGDSRSEGLQVGGRVLHNLFSRLPSQTCAPKHPTFLKPQSSAPADQNVSKNFLHPSSHSSTRCKGGAAVPATSSGKNNNPAKVIKRQFSGQQFAGKQQQSKNTGSALRLPPDSRQITSHSGGLEVESDKTWKSLFARPITEFLNSTPDSETTAACPQQSEDSRTKDVPVAPAAEPDKSFVRTFCSLFATPLSEIAAPLPHMQPKLNHSRTSSGSQESNQPVGDASHSSGLTQSPSKLETQLLVRTDAARSLKFSPSVKKRSTELINQPTRPQVKPADSVRVTSLSPHPFTTHEPLPTPSPHNIGSPVAATSDSVLKTLFLSLDPYQPDGEQQDSIQTGVPSESVKESRSSTGCDLVQQQQKCKKKRRRKSKAEDSHQQLPIQQSTRPL